MSSSICRNTKIENNRLEESLIRTRNDFDFCFRFGFHVMFFCFQYTSKFVTMMSHTTPAPCFFHIHTLPQHPVLFISKLKRCTRSKNRHIDKECHMPQAMNDNVIFVFRFPLVPYAPTPHSIAIFMFFRTIISCFKTCVP